MSEKPGREKVGTIRALLQLARPFKGRFVLISFLALLGTSADLIQPLIYRVAINDVAGLFVESPTTPTTETTPTATAHNPGPTRHPSSSTTKPATQATSPTATQKLRHHRGFVAPRTRQETLTTLLWAVVILFVISVVGHWFSLASDYQSTVVANEIEADLIQSTFGHVLRLPLSFFSRRASGSLGKRIDQSDQVAPIVSAFSQQIAPEVIRIVGICAIMLSQSWKLGLAALAVLPLYFLIARRAAVRLESGMAEYYTKWETVSARIQDALAAIKRVKLSGAEPREVRKLQEA